jgi:hypothetical protein
MAAIMGMAINYVIISGIRDSNSTPDDPTLGHHLDFEFNGIACNVNNLGEFTLTYNGASKIDGTPEDSVDSDSVGTSITITADGSLNILDKDSNESIVIDRPNGNINITASTGVTVNAPQIKLGAQANSPAVIGTQLVSILTELITQLSILTVITTVPGSPTSPPVNVAAFASIQAQLNTLLSQVILVQ